MDRLKDKVVFLTGGGGVLGRASALLFAQEGARIAVVDIVAGQCRRNRAAHQRQWWRSHRPPRRYHRRNSRAASN